MTTSNMTPQNRLTKQNQISKQKLIHELKKLEKVEKSDLRMLETVRKRFWSRHRKLENPPQSITTDSCGTRNSDFSYCSSGDTKELNLSTNEIPEESYELIRSMIFTNNEVDPKKVLCLHLLAAHSPRIKHSDSFTINPVASLLEKDRECFSGAWNSFLPCYVLDNEHGILPSEELKLHEDPRQLALEDQMMREFEEKCRRYMENNVEYGIAMSSNAKQARMVPSGLGKMPIIAPHIYSLLGVSHEFRKKQVLADSRIRKTVNRSKTNSNVLYKRNSSIHLEDGSLPSKHDIDAINKCWKTKYNCFSTGNTTTGSICKWDSGITMLKRNKSTENLTQSDSRRLCESTFNPLDELVVIKSSLQNATGIPLTTSSVKVSIQNVFDNNGPSESSFSSMTLTPVSSIRKCRRCIYLNSPIK